MAVRSEPLQIFCSFSPEDEALYKQLHSHLRLLEREGIVTLWHQRLITAGTDWAKAVDEQLTNTSIILLLISPAFFASDYCSGIEVRQAIQRHEVGTARVIPILLRPVDWALAPFAHLSALPSDKKFVAEWRNRDAAFTDIVTGLCHVIEELTSDSVGNLSKRTVSGVWNVPHRRNLHFTGRDDLLNQLQQQLSPEIQDNLMLPIRRAALTQPRAVKGLGGIGKTQIAIEYAYRSRELDRYRHILWINAASEQALLTSFVELAELFPAFPLKGETDQRKLVAAIKRWLEQCLEHWLMIFDNADDVALVRDYLPQRGNGSILLTTRADAVGSLAGSVEVETMGLIEGTHLLLRRAQRFEKASDEEINQAGNVVVALDHFPLALDQAGAYIEETKCSFVDYLELYQKYRSTLLAQRGNQANNYPDTVVTTWSLSFQKVQQGNPAAAELLHLCAFLAPDRIPEKLIRDGAAHWPSSLQQAATDLFAFNQMMQDLLQFSLVKRLTEAQTFSVHRLVQIVQIDMMEQEVQHQWAECIVRAVHTIFPHHPQDIATWSQCIEYLDQVQACKILIERYRLSLIEAADLLNRTGMYLQIHASYTMAEPLQQLALAIKEQQMAVSLNDLATLYHRQGRYKEAEKLFQQALDLRTCTLGPNHANVAETLDNLSMLYLDQGMYDKAEELCQRALSLREQLSEVDRSYVAESLNNLAEIYRIQGVFAEAEALFLRALSIREQIYEQLHPKIAETANNIGLLYYEHSIYEKSEPYYQQALAIWKEVYGVMHVDVAFAFNNLAVLYSAQGKYKLAVSFHNQALNIREQVLVLQQHLTKSSRRGKLRLLEGLKQMRPASFFSPTLVATGNGLPGSKPGRQVAPGRTSGHNPPDTLDDQTMFHGRTSRTSLRRQQRTEAFPAFFR